MPFYFDLYNYNHFDFKDSVLSYLNNKECPLCNKIHTIKFYCFIARKSFTVNNNILKVIKIKCETNYQINKAANSKLPYILTVLPAFIQPYARKSTDTIINTVNKYINLTLPNKYESSLEMGVENIESFNLYFNRILNRVDQWIVNLSQKISELAGISNYEKKPYSFGHIKQKWDYFIKLIHEYCDIIERLKTKVLLLKKNRVCFVFAIFCRSMKSLGP